MSYDLNDQATNESIVFTIINPISIKLERRCKICSIKEQLNLLKLIKNIC